MFVLNFDDNNIINLQIQNQKAFATKGYNDGYNNTDTSQQEGRHWG